jgi:hypothetical protein
MPNSSSEDGMLASFYTCAGELLEYTAREGFTLVVCLVNSQRFNIDLMNG